MVGAGNLQRLWIPPLRTTPLGTSRSGQFFSVKEEDNYYHVNQAYNKFVANQDKKIVTSTLSLLRISSFIKVPMEQYSLIRIGLAGVCANTQGTRERPFRACNPDPRCKSPFTAWCTKISHFLQPGQTFKTETLNGDPYLLLPAIWHGMIHR